MFLCSTRQGNQYDGNVINGTMEMEIFSPLADFSLADYSIVKVEINHTVKSNYVYTFSHL